MHNAPKPGAQSLDLSQAKSVAQLAQLLQPYFLSSSLGTAPLAQGTSGNRTTVLTTASNNYVASLNGKVGALTAPPVQVTTQPLIAGALTWTYATAFVSAPIILALPIGVPAAGALLYANAPSNTAVTITSTNGSDTRTIMLLAYGNPS